MKVIRSIIKRRNKKERVLADNLLQEPVWLAYRALRSHIVWKYFEIRFLLKLTAAPIIIITTIYVWSVWQGDLTFSLESIGSLLLYLSVTAVTCFLLGFILMPGVKVLMGGLIGWSSMGTCISYMWDRKHEDICRHQHQRTVYNNQDKLAKIKELALTNSGAEWGTAATPSLFFALGFSMMITTDLWNNLAAEWRWAVGGYTVAFYFGAVMSALVANADAVIAQTITLIRVEGINNDNQNEEHTHRSAWFRN